MPGLHAHCTEKETEAWGEPRERDAAEVRASEESISAAGVLRSFGFRVGGASWEHQDPRPRPRPHGGREDADPAQRGDM